jgi:hypothetical protein
MDIFFSILSIYLVIALAIYISLEVENFYFKNNGKNNKFQDCRWMYISIGIAWGFWISLAIYNFIGECWIRITR